MKKIQNSDLSRLHQEEDFGFHQLVREEFAKCTDPHFTEVFTAYNEKFQHFDEVIKPLLASIHTQKLTDLDHQRDNAYHGLATQVKIMLRHHTEAKAEAAQKVHVILNKYGDPTGLSYVEENGVMENLIQDLEIPETADALSVIQSEDWVVEMKRAHKEFVTLFAKRNNEQADIVTGQSKEARVAVDAAYKACVIRINAIAELEGDSICLEIIRNVNKEIDYQRTVLAARKTRHAKNKSQESEVKS